jgi:hypothetical protein
MHPDCCLAAVRVTRRAGTVTEQGESAGQAQPPLRHCDRVEGGVAREQLSAATALARRKRAVPFAVSWRRLGGQETWGGTPADIIEAHLRFGVDRSARE